VECSVKSGHSHRPGKGEGTKDERSKLKNGCDRAKGQGKRRRKDTPFIPLDTTREDCSKLTADY